MNFIKEQLALDIQCKTPSLLAKWLPSENASSVETRKLASRVREYLGMTHRQYRKTLSILRERINVLERLMSSNQWDKIVFDKIPSKAGLVYRNAFARRDIIAKKYESFIKSDKTKVNADTLYPYEIVNKVTSHINWDAVNMTELDRAAIEKYWNNQKDYLNGADCRMMTVVDTSGSMTWGGLGKAQPIDVAISLGMYCAERVGGPFKDHYISFSSRPQFIKIEGIDFADKVKRIYRTNLCENTNIETTFDLLLKASLKAKPEDRLKTVVIISDMQIDVGSRPDYHTKGSFWTEKTAQTEMEKIRKKWESYGLEMPNLVYWNVNASKDTILDAGPNVSFVSGCSPSIFQQVLTGKTGWALCLDKLLSERYKAVK